MNRRKNSAKRLAAALVSCCLLGAAADFPQAAISNGAIHAVLYLPDAHAGYYRGTRFDWSGQIPSLEFRGHTFFGQWNPAPYSPTLHDAIMGPVEEFLTDGAGLGYAEAKPGGTFLKIGVGVIRKPEEPAFQQFKTYQIVDPGKWSVKSKADAVEFTQTVGQLSSGYAYRYTKVVELVKGRPEMALAHQLTNTGKKTIESDVYEHNFYMLDGQAVGPDIAIRFPFAVHATEPLNGLAETRGKELIYLKELSAGQSAHSNLTGFSADPKDYDITEVNTKTGVSVRQTCDRPIVRINYWSIRSTACPEAYIHMKIAPGETFRWRIRYEFSARGQ
jgi:hypothetical protein